MIEQPTHEPRTDALIHGGLPEVDGYLPPLPDTPPQLPPPGHSVIIMMGLAIGLLLMALQLWLLTLAFDLYLAGKRGNTVLVALCSGLVFLGGLLMLVFVSRGPSRRS